MKNPKWNKLGDEKLFSFWWFLVMGIVGIFIIGGVWIYFSAHIDVKNGEAKILNERIIDCLFKNGKINESILEEKFDIFSECYLNKEVINEKNNFYFNIQIYKDNVLVKDISNGQIKFKQDCKIILESKIKSNNYPECIKNTFFLDEIKIEILTASNNEGESL